MVVLCGLCSPLVRCLSALPKRAVHVYTFTERLHHCTSLTLMFGTQATKKEEDRVGGDQGIHVVVDEFPNFEVGVYVFENCCTECSVRVHKMLPQLHIIGSTYSNHRTHGYGITHTHNIFQ